MKKISIFLLTVFLMLVFVSRSYAHFLWLNVNNYTPKKGDIVTVTLGWGHQFPETPKPPREEMVKKLTIFLLNPDGKKTDLSISLKDGHPQPIRFRVNKEGVYLVVATAKHFVSKTTEGYFYKAKDELRDKEVIYSKWSETTALALISVGREKKVGISAIPGSNFYMVPLINPSVLKKGDVFQVKVVLDGKPCRTWVYATYAGFSAFKDTYAWATRTDKKGIAHVEILKDKVVWLVKAEEEKHYPDPSKADIASYKCTMTFGF